MKIFFSKLLFVFFLGLSLKKFMLDLEFEIEDGIRSVTCLYEVEENIIILGSYMKLFLYDIRNNEAKLLQKFEYDNMSVFDQIIKLSNGLIAAAFFNVIIFYKYDEENKKLEKKDEIKTRGSISTKFMKQKMEILFHLKQMKLFLLVKIKAFNLK